MFSARLAASPANPLSRLLGELRARGPVVDLTESNPTRVGLAYPEAEILAALADPAALVYAPAPRGLASARAAVAADHARRGLTVDPDALLLCVSTSEAYSFLFKLLCDPGDAVLAPEPSYPLFAYLSALEGVSLQPYRLAYDGVWHIDFPALEEALAAAPRARAILVVSPNNPTGSYLKPDEHARLLALCAERGLALVCDEVFADYPADDSPAERVLLAARPDSPALVFSLGGLSKSAGLPQLKLAWIAAAGPPALLAPALDRLETIADSYLSVGAPVQHAAPRLLALAGRTRAAILARVRENRAWLHSRLPAGSPIQVLPAEAGWSAILRFPRMHTDEELALHLLREHRVLVHPGYFFDMPEGTYLVVSLLPRPEAFQAGISALFE